MAHPPIHLAVDLGASGGRVLAGWITNQGISIEEVHRFSNGGVVVGNRLQWNLLGLWQDIQNGLLIASQKFGDRIASIGVDTWGVDYGLLDSQGDLVGGIHHYRDTRTRGILDRAFERLPKKRLYDITGLQFMEFNTAFQLLASRLEGSMQIEFSDKFMMIPDLVHWLLSGEVSNEYTNASTTQLLEAESGQWSREIMDAFDIPTDIFSQLTQPGTTIGTLQPRIGQLVGLSKTPIIIPATHDTGSAVLAVPANEFAPEKPNWCYISCGTWSLMGAELPRPLINSQSLLRNFTNEGGVAGSIRFLKNISGLWIFQQCREKWLRDGCRYEWGKLVDMARTAVPLQSLIDPDDNLFVSPDDMPHAIKAFCKRTGQAIPEGDAQVARTALESLVMRYRLSLGWLEELLDTRIDTIHLVGGGAQNTLLCQMTADCCGRVVVAGPVEATALGNVAMQAIGSRKLAGVNEARQLIRSSPDIVEYHPQAGHAWDDAYQRFKQMISAE